MKDLFSTQSDKYSQFRPHYPEALITFLSCLTREHAAAWDCGTGNGQLAKSLAKHYATVRAIDLSAQQLQHAVPDPRIVYSTERAEAPSFADNTFDLITVAQDVHWFDFDAFYAGVTRVAKPGGILALIGYGLIETDEATDAVIDRLYTELLGDYWDSERRYIDELYQTIPFPFRELSAPPFAIHADWTFDELEGYLRTWSAVKHYRTQQQHDPVDLVLPDLRAAWGEEPVKTVSFRLLTRIGRIEKTLKSGGNS